MPERRDRSDFAPPAPTGIFPSAPSCTILLATLNGARWLDRQLETIEAQSWSGAIDILALDDGSVDETVAILKGWQSRWRRGRFIVSEGPRGGHSGNFRQLILQVDDSTDCYAFADQDDLWRPEKLTTAWSAIAGHDGPALYCGATLLVDEQERIIGRSAQFRRPTGFANALVQNVGGGNTMAMNALALRLLKRAAEAAPFVAHDWFSYMIVSGAGGKIVYSPLPMVLYRQHDANAVGSNLGIRARLQRFKAVMGGRFREWNDVNTAALEQCRPLLTPQSNVTLDHFLAARRNPLPERLLSLARSGIYRQTFAGQVALYSSCLLKKL